METQVGVIRSRTATHSREVLPEEIIQVLYDISLHAIVHIPVWTPYVAHPKRKVCRQKLVHCSVHERDAGLTMEIMPSG
jgi:hypothetical protein